MYFLSLYHGYKLPEALRRTPKGVRISYFTKKALCIIFLYITATSHRRLSGTLRKGCVFFILKYLFFVSFLVSPKKKEKDQKKKERGCKFPALCVLRLPKTTATFFQNFVVANFEKRNVCFFVKVDFWSLCYPLTRPNTTVGFLKTPKGAF